MTLYYYKFYVLMQGQGLYTRMDLDKFYPLVYGEDIASNDADESSAGYNSAFLYFLAILNITK